MPGGRDSLDPASVRVIPGGQVYDLNEPFVGKQSDMRIDLRVRVPLNLLRADVFGRVRLLRAEEDLPVKVYVSLDGSAPQ